MSKDPTDDHPAGCECPECCCCPKCRARRGERIYAPEPDEPLDPSGAAVRIIEGVTDEVERAVLIAIGYPRATRQEVVEQTKRALARTGREIDDDAVCRTIDTLVATGLVVVDDQGDYQLTNAIYNLPRLEE